MHYISGLDTAKFAYFALFESNLRYGIANWRGAAETKLKPQPRRLEISKLSLCNSMYISETTMHAVNTQQS